MQHPQHTRAERRGGESDTRIENDAAIAGRADGALGALFKKHTGHGGTQGVADASGEKEEGGDGVVDLGAEELDHGRREKRDDGSGRDAVEHDKGQEGGPCRHEPEGKDGDGAGDTAQDEHVEPADGAVGNVAKRHLGDGVDDVVDTDEEGALGGGEAQRGAVRRHVEGRNEVGQRLEQATEHVEQQPGRLEHGEVDERPRGHVGSQQTGRLRMRGDEQTAGDGQHHPQGSQGPESVLPADMLDEVAREGSHGKGADTRSGKDDAHRRPPSPGEVLRREHDGLQIDQRRPEANQHALGQRKLPHRRRHAGQKESQREEHAAQHHEHLERHVPPQHRLQDGEGVRDGRRERAHHGDLRRVFAVERAGRREIELVEDTVREGETKHRAEGKEPANKHACCVHLLPSLLRLVTAVQLKGRDRRRRRRGASGLVVRNRSCVSGNLCSHVLSGLVLSYLFLSRFQSVPLSHLPSPVRILQPSRGKNGFYVLRP